MKDNKNKKKTNSQSKVTGKASNSASAKAAPTKDTAKSADTAMLKGSGSVAKPQGQKAQSNKKTDGIKSGAKKSAVKQNTQNKAKSTAKTASKADKQAKKAEIKKMRAEKSKKRAMEKEQKRQLKLQRSQEKKERLQKIRTEREKKRAAIRSEQAKLKQERKELKEQASKAKAQAAKRKQAAVRQERAKAKEQKAKRKEALKGQSKEQRNKVIARERAEKSKLAAENRAYKRRLKEEKKHAAKLNREARQAQKKSSPSIAGWLAAVIALGVSVLALGSMLMVTYKNNNGNQARLNGSYERSFYDLVGYMDNLDNNLSKLQVTNTSAKQQKLLMDIVIQSELAQNNVQQLPLNDESKYQTVGFINSIGDYSKSLMAKIAAGGSLSEQEEINVAKISKVINKLKTELSQLADKTARGYSFKSLSKGKEKDIIIGKFGELENSSVDYPKLIYDGPFSSALEKRSPKGLGGLDEVTKEQANDKFKEYFSDYKLSAISFDGEVNSEAISGYNFSATADGKDKIYAQISKAGGKLVMFDINSNCSTNNFDTDTCVSIAMKYLEKAGYTNMRAVWISDSANVADINFAYTEKECIIYPDLVKVKVCQEKGRVLGIEANSYWLNHDTGRDTAAKLTEKEVRASVSSKIDIKTSRLAVIPTSGGGEVTAYEFMGIFDGSTYYVYIDADNGGEAEVFRVVGSNQGNLLM